MNKRDCLSEQDLVLHYYGELPAQGEPLRHLEGCDLCRERFAALREDLSRLPELDLAPDAATGTRMAARVNEQLHSRRRTWRPALGASAAAACALVVTLYVWAPQGQQSQVSPANAPSLATLNMEEDMPDIEFLEDLELLQELELLSQIEGV